LPPSLHDAREGFLSSLPASVALSDLSGSKNYCA
jgi:hypothetical protein